MTTLTELKALATEAHMGVANPATILALIDDLIAAREALGKISEPVSWETQFMSEIASEALAAQKVPL